MNKEEIEIQIALGTYLQTKWSEYLALQHKARILRKKAHKLHNKGQIKFHTDDAAYSHICRYKYYAIAMKLYVSADLLEANANILWYNAIITMYGETAIVKLIQNATGYMVNGEIFVENL